MIRLEEQTDCDLAELILPYGTEGVTVLVQRFWGGIETLHCHDRQEGEYTLYKVEN